MCRKWWREETATNCECATISSLRTRTRLRELQVRGDRAAPLLTPVPPPPPLHCMPLESSIRRSLSSSYALSLSLTHTHTRSLCRSLLCLAQSLIVGESP